MEIETVLHRIANAYNNKDQHLYSPYGWKKDSDNLFGTKEAVQIWQTLLESCQIPSFDQELFFFSPTANTGTHEIAIAQYDYKYRNAPSLIVLGDLVYFTEDTRTKRIHASRIQASASDIPFPHDSLNVIWDRKGWLWYCARLGEKRLIKLAFEHYYEKLVPGGVIIADAISDWSLFGQSNSIEPDAIFKKAYYDYLQKGSQTTPSACFPNATNQYEISTFELLLRTTNLKSIESLGFSSELTGEGILKSVIFKKI